jgi:hypothetical protein
VLCADGPVRSLIDLFWWPSTAADTTRWATTGWTRSGSADASVAGAIRLGPANDATAVTAD